MIEPANWKTRRGWQKRPIAKIEKLLHDFTLKFRAQGYTAHFQLWEPPEGSLGFVSMGLQKPGIQANGNQHCIYTAMGWFSDRAVTWPPGFIDHYVLQACELAKSFYVDGVVRSMRIDTDEELRRWGRKGTAVEKEYDPFDDPLPVQPAKLQKPVASGYDPFEDNAPLPATVQPKTMTCGSCGGTGDSRSARGKCWDCDGKGKVQFIEQQEVDPLS